MKAFVTRMVEEHAQLVVRINSLHEYVYSDKANTDNRAEFANKCIQLSSMRTYEQALRARLQNQGIQIDENGEYYEKVAKIEQVQTNDNQDGKREK